MQQLSLIPSTVALLLVVTTVSRHRGVPLFSFDRARNALRALLRSLSAPRGARAPAARPRRVAMRGARPWWE
ncbi:MAG: hypothetical protein Kow0092_35620 [Deferrisomatales bacterium]